MTERGGKNDNLELPFRYMMSFPIEIFTGQLQITEILSGLSLQWMWVGVFYLLYRWYGRAVSNSTQRWALDRDDYQFEALHQTHWHPLSECASGRDGISNEFHFEFCLQHSLGRVDRSRSWGFFTIIVRLLVAGY